MAEKKDADFKEMCAWIEREIFGYDENQKLQKMACLKLQGLRSGKVVANNNTENNGNYSIDVIWNTFRANKLLILKALKNKTFSSEQAKMGYVCAIVREHLNDMYKRMKNAELSKSKQDAINIDVDSYNKNNYHKQTIDYENSTFEDIW